ncbi:MAG: hypothetical protein LBH57_06385, partial [Treponema sp.]|nr:hypothetical protein [Treponema sp.]
GAYPALFAIGREAVQPRPPSLTRRLAARKLPVTVWGLADLDRQDPQDYGLAGSPTRVRKLYTPEQAAKMPPLRVEAAEAAALIRKARIEW